MRCLLLLLLPALACAAAPDSSGVAPSPRAALLRSAALPGWGQYYNGRPFKALLFAGASTGFLAAAIAEQRQLNRAQSPAEHEERAARRNTRLLYLALSTTFAALDAYVDAHLSSFDAPATASLELRPGGALLKLKADLPP